PSFTKRCTIAAPIPFAPPVTSATLPARRMAFPPRAHPCGGVMIERMTRIGILRRQAACQRVNERPSEAEFAPHRVDPLPDRLVHHDRAPPLARRLAGPFAGRVDPHLRAQPRHR